MIGILKSRNIPDEISCIICHNAAEAVISTMEGYQRGEFFDIYFCKNCDTCFAWPRTINNKVYDRIYSQASIVPGYNRYNLYTEEVIKRTDPLKYLANKESAYFAIKEILERAENKTPTILEIGSGLGYLTYAIRKKGYNIIGLDISLDAVEKAKKRFGNDYVCADIYQYEKNTGKKFDFVILTEVIEHVPNPSDFFDEITRLLAENGKLIITTPNKSIFSNKDYWETELPPIHLTWFSETSFKMLASEKQLHVSFFDFTRFNKTHIDVTRSVFYERFYKVKNRQSVLDSSGEVISPVILRQPRGVGGSVKSTVKKLLKPLFIRFFTNKRNMHRNNTLCVILQKVQN